MSTEPESKNTAKLTDPIWDSRNGDEPEVPAKAPVATGDAQVTEAHRELYWKMLSERRSPLDGAQLIANFARAKLAAADRDNAALSERLHAAETKCADLGVALADAQADTKRLDWFDKSFKPHGEPDADNNGGSIWHVKFPGVHVTNLRAAIDKAMKGGTTHAD